jgi:signal transduction histidine kinase/CheY-like chemotaxis protein
VDIRIAPVSSDPSPGPSHASRVRAEQVKVIYRYLPALIVINAVVGAAMVYGLWDVVSRAHLVIWASTMVGVLALRGASYALYRRHAASVSASRVWTRGFTIGSAASGALWGAVGVFLFPTDSLEYQLFILFILMGMGAGAVTSLTAYMPAFYAFLPICLLPISVVLFRQSEPIHTALAVMTLAYVAGLSFFGRTLNKALTESLSLRFENVDLVQELSVQRDEAERANIAKSKFLAAASHDLRQPLHALRLFTSALDERIRYPDVRKIVSNINDSVHALESLFSALLDVSRLDAGVLQPSLRHFRLEELLARLVKDYGPEAEAKGLRLERMPCDAVVHSDPALLERILRNYISNAVRYTHSGEVGIVCHTGDRDVRIEVRDTGIGIPADQQHEIFSEFHQLHNPERDRTKGLGLGLAIVDRVAKLLGHAIDVRSAPGAGSCFSVTVPRGEASRVLPDAAPGRGAAGDLGGLHVVVVDDEIGAREGMRTLLEQWGCEVTAASSQEEALDAVHAQARVPDALIVDFRLRDGRTGPQAIEALSAELRAAIPALIVTGDTAPERLREAKACGYQLVHKPVQPAMLRAFLGSVGRRKRSAQESRANG